jgi:1-deoxy-D-xylulose-5-phosphate reductoisomerase
MSAPRKVVILGSTGSIGTQALDIVRRNPDLFRVVGLSAGGGHAELLASQAREFDVPVVGISDAVAASRFAAEGGTAELVIGDDASARVAGIDCDVVLNGITGSVGLLPTLAALRSGATLALANKESLVVGGPLVKSLARHDQIVPVDSEHSAIAQALRGGRRTEVRRLILTASGGPFRGWNRDRLHSVTPTQALAHPTWDMGRVVTTNSATLVNKGLELIEAHLLFDVPFEDIEVVVHPQSVVHSMVEFNDGSTIAQASPPDMRIPIALGMNWPDRVPDAASACDWSAATTWTFEPLDHTAFPAVTLARHVGEAGGTAPAVFNAANETAVDAFHAGALPFTGIVELVQRVVAEHLDQTLSEPGSKFVGSVSATVQDVLNAEVWARAYTRTLI